MVLKKVKVIKRDERDDKRVTKTKRQALWDRRATLLKEVRKIERELQTA